MILVYRLSNSLLIRKLGVFLLLLNTGCPSLRAEPQIVVQSGHRDAIHQIALAPDGQRFATVGGGEVKIWNLNGSVVWTAQASGDARVLAWSPDGKNVAVGVGGIPGIFTSRGGNTAGVEILDAADGTPLKTFLHGNNAPSFVAYLPDGRLEARCDYGMIIWDSNGKELQVPSQDSSMLPMAPSPDHRYNAVTTPGGVQIWDGEGKRQIAALWLRNMPPGRAAWSPDSKHIATFDGFKLRVWDVATRRVIRQIPVSTPQEQKTRDPRFTQAVQSLAWAPDSKTIVVAVTWWPDAHSTQYEGDIEGTPHTFVRRVSWPGDTVSTVTPAAQGAVYDLRYLPGNQLLIAGGAALSGGGLVGRLTLIKTFVPTIQIGWTAAGYAEGVNALALSPDGKTLAAAGNDTAVRLWDWQRGVLKATLKRPSSAIFALAWSPDGRRLAELDAGSVAVWDVAGQRVIKTWKSPDVYDAISNGVAWSPDGKTVVAGTAAGIEILNVETGTLRKPPAPGGMTPFYGPVVWNKSGLWAGFSRINPQTFRAEKQLSGNGPGSETGSNSLILDSDFYDGEKRLATVGGDEDTRQFYLRVWDVGKDVIERTVHELPLSLRCVKVAPDGRHCVVGFEGGVALVDLQTLEPLWQSATGATVTDLTWSQDGNTFFAAGEDGRISLFSAEGTLRATLLKLPPHPLLAPGKQVMDRAGIEWMAWTPDGQFTGSPNATSHFRWRDGDMLKPANAYPNHHVSVLGLP